MLGKIILDLAPTPENQRNSEGAFIYLKNGDILFAYSRYSGGIDDGCTADIYGIISKDDGETFGEPFEIITHEQMNADNIMSVSFLRMANDDIGMFFLAKRDQDQCICYLIRSADEGKTWSEAVLCSEPTGYICVNNDRVIRTESGKILVPAALYQPIIRYDDNGNKIFKGCTTGDLHIYESDDDGYTWNTIVKDITIPISRGCTSGVQEPGLLETEKGKLWCFIRNFSSRQYECFSEDDGKTWDTPLPSCFMSPASPLCSKKLSDGRIIAIWNPIPAYFGRQTVFENGMWTGGRDPLVLAVSTDNGKTFGTPVVIDKDELDERRGFCYTAIFETKDNSILLGYCAGSQADRGILCRTRIRKVSLSEF